MSEKTDGTLAGIVARLESLERVARNRGSLACDHLAGRLASIRGELQQIAEPQPGADAHAVSRLRAQPPAEAQPPILWCLHIHGPDDVHPAPSKEVAEQAAKAFNERYGPIAERTGVMAKAVVAEWPHSPESHAESVGTFLFDWIIPAGQAAEAQAQGGSGSPMPATPEQVGLLQGPDDCPHLQINGVSVAVFPAGTWGEVCSALDSITGSTAPPSAPVGVDL